MSDDIWMEKGCNCADNSCKGSMQAFEECVYFIARTRGPVVFKECPVNAFIQTYQDKHGVCLHCEFESKRKGVTNEQHLHANTMVGVPKQSPTQ